jgi:hypothetical protein
VRTMSIPPFERKIEIADFDFFVRSRLAQAVVIWPEQAIPLVGYMPGRTNPNCARAEGTFENQLSRMIGMPFVVAWPDYPRAMAIFCSHMSWWKPLKLHGPMGDRRIRLMVHRAIRENHKYIS